MEHPSGTVPVDARVAAVVASCTEIRFAQIQTALFRQGHFYADITVRAAIQRLLAAGRIVRLDRGVYAPEGTTRRQPTASLAEWVAERVARLTPTTGLDARLLAREYRTEFSRTLLPDAFDEALAPHVASGLLRRTGKGAYMLSPPASPFSD